MAIGHIQSLTRDWPGKSHPAEHPALWHMLDVGAVADRLLSARTFGPPALAQALTAYVALHDLGKISGSFRAMLRHGTPQGARHWEHSGALLKHLDALLARHLGGAPEPRRLLAEAVAGHHGGPRVLRFRHEARQQWAEIGEDAQTASAKAIEAVLSLFPGASLDSVDEAQARALSWWLNGLTVQSDWLGSNPDWFPPTPPDQSLNDYWALARDRAARAVRAAGLHRAAPAMARERQVLPASAALHPMQWAVLDADLPPGPMLAVIEDATGAGKTEAALMLASRMMQAGKAAGLFFALPTMATANAMLPRLDTAASALFNTAPTLALSHGRAALSATFRDIRARSGANPEDGPHCSTWLAEDRRKVLLADLAVGTLDQALFGVLPTRFNGLRVQALSERVLIVDEAHSYDPYMQAQLERLLQMQARLGGSAILMTATLPGPKKQAFQDAFQRGLRPASRPGRRRRPTTAKDPRPPYPALSLLGPDRQTTAVDPAPGTLRQVGIKRLETADQAVALLAASAAEGAACLWVRNAVDDAIAAVSALRGAGARADLLHARFALCDRLDKEAALAQRFGKPGQGRAGRVLVATQVAEQSLDLDFDVMVSDLAPIGAMIQRAGRLWRHMDLRPAATRPVPGPVLHVLSPDPAQVPQTRWLHQVLDAGAHVYDPVTTWRSAAALFQAGCIDAPNGLRPLIEAVEGSAPLPVPPALQAEIFRHEGKDIVERQMALTVLIDPDLAFDQDTMMRVWDDEHFPTRLGVPQVTLALARRGPDGLQPWAGDGPEAWALSEVQVSAARFDPSSLDQSADDIAAIKADWTEARAHNTWVAVVEDDGRISECAEYSMELGFTFTLETPKS